MKCKQSLKSVVTLAVAATLLTLGTATSTAADITLPFARKVTYDPRADYRLTTDHGPWLVMCASFLGESGEVQAADLVRELRTEFNLPAYIYYQEFDYSGEIIGKGWTLNPDNPNAHPVQPKMRHFHVDHFVEIAVMVGDFKSLDDKKAQRTLEKIKYAKPRCLQVSPEQQTSQRMGVFREIQRLVHVKTISGSKDEIEAMGPMRKALLTPNPLLPDEYFEENNVDTVVLELNRNVEFSLFRCEGNYTVKVATFKGKSTFQLDEIEQAKQELEKTRAMGKRIKSDLADALAKAHELTIALRKRGYEAYEFHDRFESYVCIGSFDWQSRPTSTGYDEINPDIYDVMEKFKARPKDVIDNQGRLIRGAMAPLSLPELPGVQFDVQPLPIEVPKYGRRR